MEAISHVETGGNHNARGKSGEKGKLQYLESTFILWSKEVTGRVLPFNETNEEYIALKMIDKWISYGYTDRQIAWIWNSGRADTCISGVNRHNVQYDSCSYADKVLAILHNL